MHLRANATGQSVAAHCNEGVGSGQVVPRLTALSALAQVRSGEDADVQPRNGLKVRVRRDYGQASLQSGRRDQGINIPDHPGPVGRAELAPDVGVALEDWVGQEIRRDLDQEIPKLHLASGKVCESAEVLDD